MSEHDEMLLDQKTVEAMIGDVAVMSGAANIGNYGISDLEMRIELLESYWGRYSTNALLLNRFSELLQGRSYFTERKYPAVLDVYLRCRSALKARMDQLKAPPNPPIHPQAPPPPAPNTKSQHHAVQAALEKLKLPEFNGNPHKWEDFKEQVEALVVSDTTMDPAVKFRRLSSCLTGEPAQRLKGIASRGENFQTAWDSLCRRYDNRSLRFTLHMRAIISMPAEEEEAASHLNLLLNTVNESINTFRSLERPVDQWDDIFIYFITSKMAPSTRLDWGNLIEHRAEGDFATYEELKVFIEDRIRTLEAICPDNWEDESSAASSDQQTTKPYKSKKPKSTSAHAAQGSEKFPAKSRCSYCDADHFVAICKKFSDCSQAERREHAVSARLCFNCLSPNHSVDVCEAKGRCMVCSGKHHTKLHQDRPSVATTCKLASTEDPEPSSPEQVDTHVMAQDAAAYAAVAGRNVLMSTACVVLEAPSGQRITIRALLDSGAEESFVTEHVAQLLGLRKTKTNIVVSGVGGSAAVVAKSRAEIAVKSAHDPDFSFKFAALILTRLATVIPRSEVREQSWPHIADLRLADPHYRIPARIDCVLSSEVYAAALRPGISRGPTGTPTAVQTAFGWVLMGAVQAHDQGATNDVAAYHVTIDHELTKAVTRLWEIQETPSTIILTPEEEACMQHFKTTHERDETGRYVVRLPFAKQPTLADTRKGAEACLKRLESRFQRQPAIVQPYKAFMSEYTELKHMEKVPATKINTPHASYFPHHPVFKKGNPEKIRVVFNASQKNAQGESFNSFLHTGPKLQEDILALIARWSFTRFAKMFRQFAMHPEDIDWQRILWRERKDQPVDVYRPNTVTYGTACAPFLANACMIQLAEDEQENWPLGAEILKKARYADDFLAGGDSLEEAVTAAQQLIKILESAGMTVGKWASSNAELLYPSRTEGLQERRNGIPTARDGQQRSDGEDPPALTPGHFLIGAPLVSPPEEFEETNETGTAAGRWKILVLMRNSFWKRWQREFLVQLQQRSKWLHPNRDFKVGDVVLFKDDLHPPTKWPLARITELRPGQDGLSRVAVIKTATSELVRSINKLILLPVNEEASVHLAVTRSSMAGG